MFFKQNAKKQLEQLIINKYGYHLKRSSSALRKENENNKFEIRFSKHVTSLQVGLYYDIDEAYQDIVWETLDKWAPTLDNRLLLAVLYDEGVEFELKENIDSVNVDYIIYLMDKITDKFNEIIYNLE